MDETSKLDVGDMSAGGIYALKVPDSLSTDQTVSFFDGMRVEQ